MIEKLANFDEELADLYLSEEPDQIPIEAIEKAIRSSIHSHQAVPLLCGSSLKNRGI
jgi:elongation factor G